ncbi:MAG TPA: EAL domain-containing protein [Thermoanaerobaculia bacterium]|jgi:EAL domain-containing protein (putative c-di-GMP-specific phosphodiesterase class I)
MLHSNNDLVLLIDDDRLVRTSVATALEREGRTVLACSDIESAQVLMETFPIRAAVADVRLSGAFAFEGLDFIDYAHEKRPAMRVVLISGDISAELRIEAAARGAAALLQKPCLVADIEAAIAIDAGAHGTAESHTIHVPDMDEVLGNNRLHNFYQPIVRAGEGKLFAFGYESLARISIDASLNNPEILFRYAERKKRLIDLELACLQNTFRTSERVPAGSRIFLNVHPRVLSSGDRFSNAVVAMAQRQQIALNRFVFEITEQGELSADAATMNCIARLRDLGAAFAFDDLGIAYSHLCHVPAVRPQFLKISQHFGTGFEADPFRRKIVCNIASLAKDLGVEAILEGVETRETADAARDIGITLMQGYFFGRPADVSQLRTTVVEVN